MSTCARFLISTVWIVKSDLTSIMPNGESVNFPIDGYIYIIINNYI